MKNRILLSTTKSRVKKFSYSEVFAFSYFSFCTKKSLRYKQYQKYEDVYKKKLDIKNLIINQGMVNSVTNLILKPYQAKLISEFEDLHDMSIAPKEEIELDKALNSLLSEPHRSEGDPLKNRIDKNL